MNDRLRQNEMKVYTEATGSREQPRRNVNEVQKLVRMIRSATVQRNGRLAEKLKEDLRGLKR